MRYVPIRSPGGFAPTFALGQGDHAGNLAVVSPDAPLAVRTTTGAVPAAVEGNTGAPRLAGPFAPTPFAPIYLALSGEWEGSVRLLRSTDGGINCRPLTLAGAPWAIYSGPVCEESESGAALYLELAPVTGTIAYRLSQ